MYDFVYEPVASLGRGGQLLIWTMRAWVGAVGVHKCQVPATAPAFAKLDMIGALQPFHMTMLILNKNGHKIFGFALLQCYCVFEHEAIMLRFFSAIRDDRPDEVTASPV